MGIHYTVVLLDEFAWNYAHLSQQQYIDKTIKAMEEIIGDSRKLEYTHHDSMLIVDTGKGWPGEYFWKKPGVLADTIYTMRDRDPVLQLVTRILP